MRAQVVWRRTESRSHEGTIRPEETKLLATHSTVTLRRDVEIIRFSAQHIPVTAPECLHAPPACGHLNALLRACPFTIVDRVPFHVRSHTVEWDGDTELGAKRMMRCECRQTRASEFATASS